MNTKKIIRGIVSQIFGDVGSSIISIIFGILIARTLSVTDFGLYSLGLGIIFAMSFFDDFGIQQALKYFVPKNNDNPGKQVYILKKASMVKFGITIALSVLIFVLSPYVSDFYGTPDLEPILKILSVAFFSYNSGIYLSNILLSLEEPSKSALIESSQVLNKVIGFLSILYIGSQAIYLGTVLGYLISFFLAIKILKKHIPDAQEQEMDMKPFWKFSRNIYIGLIFLSFAGRIVPLALGKFSGIETVALFTVAFSLSNIIDMPSIAIGTVLQPMVAGVKKENISEKISAFVELMVLVTLPISAFTIASSNQIINVLYGVKYVSAAPILSILAIGTAIYGIMFIYITLSLSSGRSDIFMKAKIVKGLIAIIFGIPLTYFFGAIGGAVAIILINMSEPMFIIPKNDFQKFDYPKKITFKLFLISLISTIPVFFVKSLNLNPIISLIISGVSYGILFVVLLFLFGFFKKDNIERIKNIFSKGEDSG